MKKILVTSNDYLGEVTLIYGEPGVGADAWPALLSVEFNGATLNDHQKAYIKRMAPVRYDGNFLQAWGTDKLRFLESELEVDFEKDFWTPYGLKLNKDRALIQWDKLSQANKIQAVHSLKGYLWHLQQYQWKNKMLADRYLKEKQWKNDWYSIS